MIQNKFNNCTKVICDLQVWIWNWIAFVTHHNFYLNLLLFEFAFIWIAFVIYSPQCDSFKPGVHSPFGMHRILSTPSNTRPLGQVSEQTDPMFLSFVHSKSSPKNPLSKLGQVFGTAKSFCVFIFWCKFQSN